MTTNQIPCLNDGFVQLIDHMGSDSSICNAARVSYGNHQRDNTKTCPSCGGTGLYRGKNPSSTEDSYGCKDCHHIFTTDFEQEQKDRSLIRYLMRHSHSSPFEFVEFSFLVRAPIHVARQWFRHRTWSYNEYSTRYKPAIDSFETTEPDKWRKQATNNKQGSGEYITEWPEGLPQWNTTETVGEYLSNIESDCLHNAKQHYEERLKFGVAREQARKDLPLSTYTEFYAKVDLHNLFHFLSLRLDKHAQLEIRTYAEAISKLIQPLVPISYEAFKDYRLNGCFFSSQEMEVIRSLVKVVNGVRVDTDPAPCYNDCPDSLSDREWKEFKEKLS